MATKDEIGAETASAGAVKVPVKLPVLMLLTVVVLGVAVALAAAAGCLYYLAKSGKLPAFAAARTESAGEPASDRTHPMVLEPILVNLADAGGHAYLRLGLTLNVEDGAASPDAKQDAPQDKKSGKTPSEQELAVRDTVVAVLGQQTSAWLLGPDGKEHLKIELKEALAKQNLQMKVTDVFFTDFLVQI